METTKFQNDLDRQALGDLIKRGKTGSFIYAIIWFVIAAVNGLNDTHQELLYYNLALFLTVGILRASLGHIQTDFAYRHFKAIGLTLEISVCLQSLHFGVLATYIYYNPELQDLVFPMMLTAAGVVGAGTATLAINKNIRLLYPALLIGPFFASFAFNSSETNFILACITIIFLVYIYSATRHIYGDYWSAIINSALLVEKAVELSELSVTDPLTKLHNRSYFNNHLDKEWKRASRSREPVTAMFVDLDYFKHINDKYGHAIGDLCLQKAAELLNKYGQRAGDAVARYGGEEFVVFFSNTESAGAAIIAERIIADFRAMQVVTDNTSILLRCSIGICTCIPNASISQSDLLADADAAMYQAKQKGRDRFEVFNSGIDKESRTAGLLE
jgi:diguanylate cyclase (GGDEF)-like protein